MKKFVSGLVAGVVVVSMLAQSVVSALPGDTVFRGTTGYGITIQGASGDIAVAEQQIADASDALNTGYIRFDASWAQIQAGGKTSYDWAYVDAVVAAANRHNLKVLLIPYETPAWARPAGAPTDWSGNKYAPQNLTDYTDFLKELAKRYVPQGVLDYQIWNEPNMSMFWKDTVANPRPNAQHYGELLKAAYQAIKTDHPEANVIMSGIAAIRNTGNQFGSDNINASDYMQQIYDGGYNKYFDAAAFHPYNQPFLPSDQFRQSDNFDIRTYNAWWRMLHSYADDNNVTHKGFREIMTAGGDSSKKLWVTEYGAYTDGDAYKVTEQTQAAMMADAVKQHDTNDFFGPLFFHRFKDNLAYGTPGTAEDFYGLYHSDGTPKLAVAAIRGAIDTYYPRSTLSAKADATVLQNGIHIAAQPTISGKADAYAYITVTAHSDPITCTTRADASGNWSCTLPQALPVGEHTIYVEAENPNRTTSTFGPYTVIVDGATAQPVTITPKAPNTGGHLNAIILMAIVASMFVIALGGCMIRRRTLRR